MTSVRDKVVLVTGGSAGFGKAIARAFARRGARVVIAARDEGRLLAAVAELRSEAPAAEISYIAADVTRAEDVSRLFITLSERFGRLDVLINNAGKSTRGTVLGTTPEEFQAYWELNFLSAVRCTRGAAPFLLQERGSVVFIGSLASKAAAPNLGAYAASKFPLSAYSQQLRMETADQGLHVLLVCPGPIEREDAGSRYDQAAGDLPAGAKRPGGGVKLRLIQPDVLAERIVTACERRESELVVPWKSRLLFAAYALSPSLGDWLLRLNLRR